MDSNIKATSYGLCAFIDQDRLLHIFHIEERYNNPRVIIDIPVKCFDIYEKRSGDGITKILVVAIDDNDNIRIVLINNEGWWFVMITPDCITNTKLTDIKIVKREIFIITTDHQVYSTNIPDKFYGYKIINTDDYCLLDAKFTRVIIGSTQLFTKIFKSSYGDKAVLVDTDSAYYLYSYSEQSYSRRNCISDVNKIDIKQISFLDEERFLILTADGKIYSHYNECMNPEYLNKIEYIVDSLACYYNDDYESGGPDFIEVMLNESSNGGLSDLESDSKYDMYGHENIILLHNNQLELLNIYIYSGNYKIKKIDTDLDYPIVQFIYTQFHIYAITSEYRLYSVDQYGHKISEVEYTKNNDIKIYNPVHSRTKSARK